MESQASSERNEGPGGDAILASAQPTEQDADLASRMSGQGMAFAEDISQAERAAMHPDQHDLEWRYYCHAWSH
jgi:hypothetical protein